jgi:hypothetical protein
MDFNSHLDDAMNNLDYAKRVMVSNQTRPNSEILSSTTSESDTSSSSSISHDHKNKIIQNPIGKNPLNLDDENFFGALKEWAIVCKAIEAGDQILLFRKGGIMEFRNGFELKFKNFFMFPTFEHQSKESIRPEYHMVLDQLEKENHDKTPDSNQFSNNNTEITSFVEITHFNEVPSLDSLKQLEQFQIWTDDYLKTRFNYNPKKPLYMLLLRAHKFNKPIQIVNKPQWVGCKSWIQIDSHDQDLDSYFEHCIPSDPFDYLKSISNPCIDDDKFIKLSEKVRSVI